MMTPTHRLIGGTTSFAIGLATELPMTAVIGVTAVSAAVSSFPDDLERPFRLPHRQVTHYPLIQILAVLAISILLLAFSSLSAGLIFYFAIALTIAWLMHSIADAMTIDKRGIALLWPYRRRGYHLLPPRLRPKVGTYSLSEMAFSVIWVLIVLCFMYVRFRHSIPA